MQFEISRDGLLRPIQQVVGVVERRHTLPVLANLLLRLEDGVLLVVGTDLEVELAARTQVIKGENGSVTVPARKLLDICRSLDEDATLRVSQEESGRIVLRAGRSRFTLSTLPADDFPLSDELAASQEFHLPEGLFRSLIEKTHFCMAHQDVRFFLNGLLLELRDCLVRAVATDGHRLAICDKPTDISMEEVTQILVPRKGVSELLRLLGDSDTEVVCRLNGSQIQVWLSDARFTSKLIDGKFPDYTRVIPDSPKNRMVTNRAVLRQALQRTAILSNEKFRGVQVTLSSGLLKLVAHNPEQEVAEEEMEVQYVGEPIDIGFNASYLQEALGGVDTEECTFAFRDSSSSCVIEGNGGDHEGECRYVVMPMRL